MRIEVTIARTTPLPAGAVDALAGELSRRIQDAWPDITTKVGTSGKQQPAFRAGGCQRRQNPH